MDFFKNIFLSKKIEGLEKLKAININYQKELGRQEMAIVLQNIITQEDNEQEVVKFLNKNLTTIEVDFETRKKIAEFKPNLFPIIIKNQDKLQLEFEHFKDFIFYLDYNLNLDNSKKINPHYEKNIKESLKIIKAYTQKTDMTKNNIFNSTKKTTKKNIL